MKIKKGFLYMDRFDDAWKVICDYCKKNITDVAYNTWISKIEPIGIDLDNKESHLLVPNDFHRKT